MPAPIGQARLRSAWPRYVLAIGVVALSWGWTGIALDPWMARNNIGGFFVWLGLMTVVLVAVLGALVLLAPKAGWSESRENLRSASIAVAIGVGLGEQVRVAAMFGVSVGSVVFGLATALWCSFGLVGLAWLVVDARIRPGRELPPPPSAPPG
jgi:hypothetical protein